MLCREVAHSLRRRVHLAPLVLLGGQRVVSAGAQTDELAYGALAAVQVFRLEAEIAERVSQSRASGEARAETEPVFDKLGRRVVRARAARGRVGRIRVEQHVAARRVVDRELRDPEILRFRDSGFDAHVESASVPSVRGLRRPGPPEKTTSRAPSTKPATVSKQCFLNFAYLLSGKGLRERSGISVRRPRRQTCDQ